MEDHQRIRKLAELNFENGLLCAESVVSALAEYQCVQHPVIPKMATVFCSGMSRTCGACGVLTGAMMGISLSLGRETKEDKVDPSYNATQKLVHLFETELGSKNCDELLGCDIGTAEGQAAFKSNNLRLNCLTYTGRATEIAVKIINENV